MGREQVPIIIIIFIIIVCFLIHILGLLIFCMPPYVFIMNISHNRNLFWNKYSIKNGVFFLTLFPQIQQLPLCFTVVFLMGRCAE